MATELDLQYVDGNLLTSFMFEGTVIMIYLQLYGVGTVVCSTLGLELDLRYVEGNRPYSFVLVVIELFETLWVDFDF